MAQARSTKALNELKVFSQRRAILRKRLILLKKTFNKMALFVERPVDGAVLATGWISFDMCARAQIVGNESAKVIGIVGRIHDHMLRVRQPSGQAARLRAVTPLAGRDHGSDRQAERIDGGVDLRPLS